MRGRATSCDSTSTRLLLHQLHLTALCQQQQGEGLDGTAEDAEARISHRIIEWLGAGGTLKVIQFQPLAGCPGPIHSLGHLQGWSIHFSLDIRRRLVLLKHILRTNSSEEGSRTVQSHRCTTQGDASPSTNTSLSVSLIRTADCCSQEQNKTTCWATGRGRVRLSGRCPLHVCVRNTRSTARWIRDITCSCS